MQFLRFLTLLLQIPAVFAAINGPDTFHWAGKLPPGQIIEIKGVNGAIHALPAEGQTVEVIAQKTGQSSDPSEIQVKVLEHERGVTVYAVYPSSLNGNDVDVDFLVRVPPGVRFIGRTVNGAVEASRLNADAEAHSVNGDIRLSTSGTARAETINGSIQAAIGKVIDAATFSTSNGGITLEIGAGAHADIHARTVNGAISANVPLTIRGRLVSKRADGRIGGGGPELNLNTVNGTIRLYQTCDFSM